jgi:hypothetical protein
MRSRAVAAVIALSCASIAPFGVPAAVASPVAGAATCVHARIGGHKKCLAVGQSCAQRYAHQYESHGFVCIKSGRHYRLAYGGQQ